MLYGTRITYGISNWQIFRCIDSFGHITLGGSYRLPEGAVKAGVKSAVPCVRLAREDDNSYLSDWIKADYFDSGRWEAHIDIPKGGLYRLESCLDAESAQSGEHWLFRGDIRTHIGCGEIFVIAGQSNAAGYGKGAALDSPDIMVHVKRNSGMWDMATHPLNDATDAPDCPNAPMGQTGTSPFISFGKARANFTAAPVGLLPCAQGGSPIRLWDPRQDGSLFKNMIAKIRKAGGADAILWYQGCADAEKELAPTYYESFERLVNETRKALGCEISFYTFQLNKYKAVHDSKSWDIIRQAQLRAAREIKNVFILPTADLSLSDEIHLSSASNTALGARLAAQMNRGTNAPSIEKCLLTGEKTIKLEFANVTSALMLSDKTDANEIFELLDETGRINISGINLDKNNVTLKLERAPEGKCLVSYEREQMRCAGSLKDNLTLLPALSFTEQIAIQA